MYSLRAARRGMRDEPSEIAVVGQQEQSLRLHVEAADRLDVFGAAGPAAAQDRVAALRDRTPS